MIDNMNGFPRLTPLTNGDWVGKELYKRKNMFGHKAKPRAIWIRAVSNAVHVKDGFRSDYNIIVGGILSKNGQMRGSFDLIYKQAGRNISDRPMAGIISLHSESKGEYATLRKLTINWECSNYEDLDRLAPYWLSPGVSIFVEWGWSNGSNIISIDINTSDKLINYADNFKNIYKDIIEKSNGNQNAYLGIISNFSWNENEDGTYSCVTELTSWGQTLLTLDLNRDKVYQGSIEQIEKEKTSTIKSFINDNFTDGKLETLINVRTSQKYIKTKDIYIAKKQRFLWLDEDKIYVSWNFIENAVINDQMELKFQNDKSLFRFDSSNIKISNDLLLYTTNADVLLIVKGQDSNAKNFDADNTNEGYINNLYINSKYVKDIFDSSETLYEALNKILIAMSNSAASIWNFKIQPDPTQDNILRVIDMNYTSKDDINNIKTKKESNGDDQLLSFGGYSGKSILSGISITSKLTDQLSLKYFATRNREDGSNICFNDDNDGGMDSLFSNIKDRVFDVIKPPESNAKQEGNKDKNSEQKEKNFSISLKELRQAIISKKTPKVSNPSYGKLIVYDEEGINILTEYINRKIEFDENGNIIENGNQNNETRFTPIYPIEISVTIDGMSGIIPGHCFTLDNIPTMYKKNGVFLVVECSDEIKNDDWTTTLRCFFKKI